MTNSGSLIRQIVGTDEILAAIEDLQKQVKQLGKVTMALSAAEQAKIDAIQTSITSFGSELHTILDAATSTNTALTEQVAELSAHIDELNALDVTEDAEAAAAIEALTADRDALQATLDSHASDVLGGLDSVASSLDALDSQFGGDAPDQPAVEPEPPVATTLPA